MSAFEHKPVLVKSVLKHLAIEPGEIYVDATFGRGGHSQAILEQLSADGRLIVIDKDSAAIDAAQAMMGEEARVLIEQGSFAMLEAILKDREYYGTIAGILIDLGVSSPQLDDPARGFSFMRDGPLDMRMDVSRGQSAAEWLATVDEQTLSAVFKEFGEERFAYRIARAVINERESMEFTTTKQLADVIAKAHPAWEKSKHPATRCFQAIRIFINNELHELKTCLNACLEALKVGGRLCVISFHSLEDRIVKRFMRQHLTGDYLPKDVPVTDDYFTPRLKKIGKLIRPDSTEISMNPRARSAVLRVAEKLS